MNSLKLASGETIEVTSEEIIAAQAENGTLKLSGEQVSERAEDAYSNTASEDTNGEPSTGANLAPTGSIVVNGVEVPVSLDMLVTRLKIGRASCRERVEIKVIEGAFTERSG